MISEGKTRKYWISILALVLCSFSVQSQEDPSPNTVLRYVGSSTIGNLIQDAEGIYGKINFDLNTEPESAGGEQAIIEGRADLAGVANLPSTNTLGKGVVSSLVGWDAIAIITHESNPVKNLTLSQLKDIFTAKITNWNQLGGSDLAIQPYIVSIESATHKVYRSVILGEENYAGCKTVSPDVDILDRVQQNPGAIGHISFSFLKNGNNLNVLSVNGQPLTLTNSNYPITRPLYFLWWPGRREVADFVDWTLSAEGQRLVMQRFIGAREGTVTTANKSGTLVVYTETYPVEDGGTFYYPHRPYEVLTTDRQMVMRVSNHLSRNDENPTKVHLVSGNYLIRPESSSGMEKEIFCIIEPNKLTKIKVDIPSAPRKETSETPATPAEEIDLLMEEIRELDRFKMLQPYGDLRVRGEQDFAATSDRFRGRFRARAGIGANISPSTRINLRFTSSNNSDDPNSPYADFNDGFNQVSIVIDRAYVHFNPQKFNVFKLWLGKMSNPFFNSGVYSELMWDADVHPEGVAFSFDFSSIRKIHRLTLINGMYFLSQFKTGAEKAWLNASQANLAFGLSKNLNLNLSSGLYYFNGIADQNVVATVFDGNAGNATYQEMATMGGDTIFTEHYLSKFQVIDNFLLLDIKNLPMLLQLKGQFFYNFGAKDANTGFAVGFSYGDLNDEGSWRLYYQYQRIQQDAVFSPFVQDDFLRQTNFKGHVFGFAYAFHKKISLHGWGLLDKPEGGTGEKHTRFRLDLNIKI